MALNITGHLIILKASKDANKDPTQIKQNMKTITVTEEWYHAALKCAEYIDQDQSTFPDFEKHLKNGKEPNDHIAYQAAIVGGWEDSIQETINKNHLNK